MPAPPPNRLWCPEHGAVDWQGDVVCSACGLLFPIPRLDPVPDTCSCKAQLLPDGRGTWSARPACPLCAHSVTEYPTTTEGDSP